MTDDGGGAVFFQDTFFLRVSSHDDVLYVLYICSVVRNIQYENRSTPYSALFARKSRPPDVPLAC